MESISMDLKVMPTSFRGYNYLLVMRCNHSRFIITDTLKNRKASEVAESLFQKLICAHGTNIKDIYCDLDTAFKNEIVSTLFKTLGITVKFCSVQSHQSNPAERALQSISNIIIHYITKYSNLWCIMSNMATFCLNIIPINHLQSLSCYEIVYGHKPPAITDLQLEGDDLIRPTFYRFSDYLDLPNECVHAIRDIVKEHYNQTIQKRLVQHGSESLLLRSFSEGDIVYFHFQLKNIISDLKLPSKKLQMSFVGPLYIFSKHVKFMYLLSTIDGEVIEQTFHMSCLKRGLLRLPNGKSVNNINVYKLEMICLRQQHVVQTVTHLTDNSQTLVKTLLYTHKNDLSPISHDTDTSHIWFQSPTISQTPTSASKTDLLHLYHAHASMPTSTDAITDTVFSPVEQLQVSCHSFTVSKCRFKFGNLQIFCYYSHVKPLTALWVAIPHRLEDDFIASISAIKLCITGSREKYVSKHFEYL